MTTGFFLLFSYQMFCDHCGVFLVFALEELQCLPNAEKTGGSLPALEVPGEVT